MLGFFVILVKISSFELTIALLYDMLLCGLTMEKGEAMRLEKSSQLSCTGDSRECVMIGYDERPDPEEVIRLAKTSTAYCKTCNLYHIKFAGCCEDEVSEEGLREALAAM